MSSHRWKRSRSFSTTLSNGVVVVPLLLIAPDVQIPEIGPAISQSVDHPGISVEGENDRLILREQGIERPVGETVRMLARRWQLQQVDHFQQSHLPGPTAGSLQSSLSVPDSISFTLLSLRCPPSCCTTGSGVMEVILSFRTML